MNEVEGDCENARARDTGGESYVSELKAYDAAFRVSGTVTAGIDRFHGTTGEVARKAEEDALFASAPLSRSRKSPECSAERGRAISKPADAWSRSSSGVAVRKS